ncbi:hypothetical protein IMSAGC017_01208 [Thomasclavelia cocleata]|uniref:Phage integrase family protein n=1 Tax=Thomasclavelia cocleata TaxID=69824 RepID=A0A829ZB34_9FIRM|nr:hypothetical protein [Thomasclavelia cocleata]GFI41165.1 hypothetical protein IMSAGC017_01208 [Thomasclavelia cocleata]
MQFTGGAYSQDELDRLFQTTKGVPLELGIYLVAFFSLRCVEVAGIEWNAIDFESKTIRIGTTSNNYKYENYIYVDKLGIRIKPGYITHHFALALKKNNLRYIHFHD